jgi:hypothetical protein
LCELPADGRGIDEVDERPLAADFHDREPFAVGLLELGDARDVHLLELEPELGLQVRERPPRALAEVAPGRPEQPDLSRYG